MRRPKDEMEASERRHADERLCPATDGRVQWTMEEARGWCLDVDCSNMGQNFGPSEWADLARNLWIGLNIVGRFGLKLVDWVEHSEPVWSKTCWIRLMGCVEPA